MILGEREYLKDAIATLEAERDDWKARCEAACNKVTQQTEQIARLRDWLEWTMDYLPSGNSENCDKIRELLKETAP